MDTACSRGRAQCRELSSVPDDAGPGPRPHLRGHVRGAANLRDRGEHRLEQGEERGLGGEGESQDPH